MINFREHRLGDGLDILDEMNDRNYRAGKITKAQHREYRESIRKQRAEIEQEVRSLNVRFMRFRINEDGSVTSI